MNYSGYSDYSDNTEVVGCDGDDAETLNEPNKSGGESPDSRFDLLSFLATALMGDSDEEDQWTARVFFSIHLGPWNMVLPWKVYSGTSFAVTLIKRKFLLRQTPAELNYTHSVRRLLAIKTPKLGPQGQSSHNSKLLRSLAKEYQILKTEPLAKHQNLVTAYGCCWQTLPTGPSQPTPALVLEGTTLGDLSNFNRSRSLTLRERLMLGMDITSGLDALHTYGVVHGDLKPNNILVFNLRGRGYTAKLADFGSAVLLSETTFPCRAPSGTKVYRAPECADESARLSGRDGLVKTDLFSLGITMAFLLIGSHIVDAIAALSDSELQSLKKGNQLADWIVAHRHDRYSAPTAMWSGSSDWTADPGWIENSLFADDELSCWFVSLNHELLAADASQRLGSAQEFAIALSYMLRHHLQMLHQQGSEPATTSKTDRLTPSPTFWPRMAALMDMSNARLRKLTGERIASKTRIREREVIAIAACCDQPGSYLKEARFIIEWNTGEELKLKMGYSKRLRAKRAFLKPRGKRFLIQANVVSLADRMVQRMEESVDSEVTHLMDLKIVSLQKTMFKPSEERNIFWMLPHPVLELVENQLLQEATNARNAAADRADAAYEYAVVVFNSKDPADAIIDSALELLTFAARHGQLGAQASVGRLCDVFGRPLPASRDEEMAWLLAASRAGSGTAQRRFRDLDKEAFATAMRGIRQGDGAICPLLNQALLAKSRWVRQTASSVDHLLYSCLHESALTGNVELLLRLPLELPPECYEAENGLGEAPLVMPSLEELEA